MTQASLAYISTIIGGGIVSLPYAFVSAGVYTGLAVHISSVLLMLLSVWFCLKSKDFLGYEYVIILDRFNYYISILLIIKSIVIDHSLRLHTYALEDPQCS